MSEKFVSTNTGHHIIRNREGKVVNLRDRRIESANARERERARERKKR